MLRSGNDSHEGKPARLMLLRPRPEPPLETDVSDECEADDEREPDDDAEHDDVCDEHDDAEVDDEYPSLSYPLAPPRPSSARRRPPPVR